MLKHYLLWDNELIMMIITIWLEFVIPPHSFWSNKSHSSSFWDLPGVSPIQQCLRQLLLTASSEHDEKAPSCRGERTTCLTMTSREWMKMTSSSGPFVGWKRYFSRIWMNLDLLENKQSRVIPKPETVNQDHRVCFALGWLKYQSSTYLPLWANHRSGRCSLGLFLSPHISTQATAMGWEHLRNAVVSG